MPRLLNPRRHPIVAAAAYAVLIWAGAFAVLYVYFDQRYVIAAALVAAFFALAGPVAVLALRRPGEVEQLNLEARQRYLTSAELTFFALGAFLVAFGVYERDVVDVMTGVPIVVFGLLWRIVRRRQD